MPGREGGLTCFGKIPNRHMTQPRNGPLQHGCCHWTSSGHGLFQNIAHVIFAGSIFDSFQSKIRNCSLAKLWFD